MHICVCIHVTSWIYNKLHIWAKKKEKNLVAAVKLSCGYKEIHYFMLKYAYMRLFFWFLRKCFVIFFVFYVKNDIFVRQKVIFIVVSRATCGYYYRPNCYVVVFFCVSCWYISFFIFLWFCVLLFFLWFFHVLFSFQQFCSCCGSYIHIYIHDSVASAGYNMYIFVSRSKKKF